MTLTLNFQGQIQNLLYLSQKRSDCHETKSKYIDWTLGLKCDIRFYLYHHLDLEFWRANIESAISEPKVVRLPRNEAQTYRLISRPQMWSMGLTFTKTLTFWFSMSNVTLTYDHTHDLDHGMLWSSFEIAVSQNGRNRHWTRGGVRHSWIWP